MTTKDDFSHSDLFSSTYKDLIELARIGQEANRTSRFATLREPELPEFFVPRPVPTTIALLG